MKTPESVLKKYFGYKSFRPLQRDIIQHALDGHDSLVLMPTGGGKSLCFQIPALVNGGMALVISPLISLMQDQVSALLANGIPAAYVNSTQSPQEQMQLLQHAHDGKLKLLYVSPEKLMSPDFSNALQHLPLRLIAIDEAHCISSWGHDFRPEYTQLGRLKRFLPQVPIMALTATADKATRMDILQQLGIPEAKNFMASFDRPNLHLKVEPGRKKIEKILNFIDDREEQSGIVYCISRKDCEKVAERLQMEGLNAEFYHAGMSADQRQEVQDDFINDRTKIICATIAFGMGIDKSNVRWVIHYNLPRNMEGYYQEIGRAGRDGLPSDTLLFYSFADVVMQQQFVEESGQAELQQAKLDRMHQYAEASVCRRKILLSYFNEVVEEDCGNCDVCENPPRLIDGTVIAQKAMSAVYRCKGQVSAQTLINILRGSRSKDVIEAKYDELKTYGVGKDISFAGWQHYLLQMMHHGALELSYADGNRLKLTELSKKILFENQSLSLVEFKESAVKKSSRESNTTRQAAKPVEKQLFDYLKETRLLLSRKLRVPAYTVFSDATLRDMAKKEPRDTEDLLEVSGIGDHKAQKYGSVFLETIKRYKQDRKDVGAAYKLSYELNQKGHSPDEVAEMRGINRVTAYSHLATAVERKLEIRKDFWINRREIERVEEALTKLGSDATGKDLVEILQGEMEFGKIRLAFALCKAKANAAFEKV